MKPSRQPFTNAVRPTTAPKPVIDLKHIRQNPTLYEQTCIERNYKAQAAYPARIISLHEEWQARQREGRALRERSNLLRRQIANPASTRTEDEGKTGASTRDELLEEARQLKTQLGAIEEDEARLQTEIRGLALALPNLTSEVTPRGDEPLVLSYINDHPEPVPGSSDRVWRSHVHIGAELGILDFAGAATASGWGWYYLLNEGAQLEQALVSYALATATRYGWGQVSPPSMVYSHIAAACGFQPRDASGETQVYGIAQGAADRARGRPELCMAGTAEIPLAGMRADTVLDEAELPCRRVAVSRCYRAEAGARGADTKGLYRVHEFTKVELFAWTRPDAAEADELFDEMVDMQTEILGSLGLHCRVLEMPSGDLGASATRKNDIEAWFPSRARRTKGWGEVTSASICTDYQTRRLGTRVRVASEGGKMSFPWTVNGTAMAVPRVLAAILETGWDEGDMTVRIPEVLRPWMDGREKIGLRHRLR
ncbi:seryl-tRNA synthetase [Cryphonectria parasitica EP155]|uniref:serine--tRNA ligase n=1 Tax=Cryphonectria parasitica (strain ATCC 38755 / EP155) TaxID=660469 RepID=A0A9P5CPC4_CRYP1|nr:seryl-tRNA synthetase [Cryphonectria parasitica EP155]KAF3766324.1 seryl-tRNA synthetase [Cryphonectria parasitica EP155]